MSHFYFDNHIFIQFHCPLYTIFMVTHLHSLGTACVGMIHYDMIIQASTFVGVCVKKIMGK